MKSVAGQDGSEMIISVSIYFSPGMTYSKKHKAVKRTSSHDFSSCRMVKCPFGKLQAK